MYSLLLLLYFLARRPTSAGTTECYPLVLSCETLALKSCPADCHTDQIFLCFIVLFLFIFLLSYENGFESATFTRDRWQRLTSKPDPFFLFLYLSPLFTLIPLFLTMLSLVKLNASWFQTNKY